jgi:UDP-N-acetylmuramate-alanine ligase
MEYLKLPAADVRICSSDQLKDSVYLARPLGVHRVNGAHGRTTTTRMLLSTLALHHVALVAFST